MLWSEKLMQSTRKLAAGNGLKSCNGLYWFYLRVETFDPELCLLRADP